MKNFNSYPYRTQNAADYVANDEDDSAEDSPDPNFASNGDFYSREDSKRHPKKRKLDSFVSRRENWSEEDTSLLLRAWGDRFMELGRRSLRPEDWAEVTEKVSEMSGIERSEADCRNQLDALKNKYKKERAKVESGSSSSKWGFFKKMDVLLNPRLRVNSGFLGCGVDSGEYVFTNPSVYLEKSNVLDEMRDSPVESDVDCESDEEESEENENEEDSESSRMLNESIKKFGEMYEKVEESKNRQMLELESLRQSFQRELELQKKQIFERAQAEITKIRETFDEEDDDDEEEGEEDEYDSDETETSSSA